MGFNAYRTSISWSRIFPDGEGEVNEEGFNEEDETLLPHMLDNKEGWVYMLTCLKGYLEFGVNQLRAGLVK